MTKIILWILATVAALFMLVPYWLPYLISKKIENKFSIEQIAHITHESIELDIHDMYCPACAVKIQKKLQELNGVLSADVDYDKKIAIVEALPNQVSDTILIEVIKAEGYDSNIRTRKLVKSIEEKKNP